MVVSSTAMDPASIHAFMQRDRTSVEDRKRDHWAEAYRRLGPEHMLLAAARMYAYARAVRPDFPTERDLAEDLAHHVALKQRLMSVAYAFPRR